MDNRIFEIILRKTPKFNLNKTLNPFISRLALKAAKHNKRFDNHNTQYLQVDTTKLGKTEAILTKARYK